MGSLLHTLSDLTLLLVVVLFAFQEPSSYSFAYSLSMAPNIQRLDSLPPPPQEDDRIRCALLGCGMVSHSGFLLSYSIDLSD